jgi:hypothetical protein
LTVAERQPDKDHILMVIKDAISMARMVEEGLIVKDRP